MNKKISGAKMVLVPIRQTGKNYLPFVEDLKNRYIKFIDFHKTAYLPEVSDPGVASYTDGTLYLTLNNEVGNLVLFNHMPVESFDYTRTSGVRQLIGAKLSLQNCYIECSDASQIGKTVALIFYYDLPQFSARNSADMLITDYVSVPITTNVFRNQFPDIERMTGKRFRLINALPTSTTPDFETGLSTGFDEVYLTIRKGSYNVIENLPLMVLWQVFMLEKLEFANIICDLNSCYLVVGGAGTGNNYTGKSVFFNLSYEK